MNREHAKKVLEHMEKASTEPLAEFIALRNVANAAREFRNEFRTTARAEDVTKVDWRSAGKRFVRAGRTLDAALEALVKVEG